MSQRREPSDERRCLHDGEGEFVDEPVRGALGVQLQLIIGALALRQVVAKGFDHAAITALVAIDDTDAVSRVVEAPEALEA